MIRYYTYYSYGGYKDLYIGSDTDYVDASYFIPLINVWKKSDKSGVTEKIARAERVQHVKIISKTDNAGFPSECNLMFSHGGYNAIYRTLKDGRTCLCIRDISNNLKDEEGRDIPFNFLFLADGDESINKLDAFALHYLSDEIKIKCMIADAISYDPIINGLKFDLSKLNETLIPEHDVPLKKLAHKDNSIDFLIIGSRKQYSSTLSEQGIKESMVNAMFDSDGLFYGALAYHKVIPLDQEAQTVVNNQINKIGIINTDDALIEENTIISMSADKKKSTITKDESEQVDAEVEHEHTTSDKDLENTNLSDLKQIVELSTLIIQKEISLLASKEDIENLHDVLNKLSSANQERAKNILDIIKKKMTDQSTLPVIVPVENPFTQLCKKNNLIYALLILIAGFVLGALVF